MDWKALKSGSDIRGTAVGINAVLTPDVAEKFGYAFASILSKKEGIPLDALSVSLGRDSRISGEMLLDAVSHGIRKAGASVLEFGLCTTPAMFMSIISGNLGVRGAIMVTASHHPFDKNGLKFFTEKGGLESHDIDQLIESASALDLDDLPVKGSVSRQSFLPAYKKLLADRIHKGLQDFTETPLKGLHIVVDAGNGAGGFYADMLDSLGASVGGSQFLDPDGMFPNHIPNPENAEAMNSLRNAVLSSGADLGVIFDADCDRAAIVDSDGKEINRNRLIALISAILLEKEKGITVVTDSVTSSGLKMFIESRGGIHHRFKRGYRNVIDEAVRLNHEGISCPVAIETSGHAALRENHFLDDGMYLVTVLIVKALQLKKDHLSLGNLISDLKEPYESREIRIRITDPDFRRRGREIITHVENRAESDPSWHMASDSYEGIRVSFDRDSYTDACWFLLRLSVHDPVLPLNLESDVPGGIDFMMSLLKNELGEMDGISIPES